MEKTAIEELIDTLNKLKIDSKPTNRTGDYRIGLDAAIVEATNLMTKEKIQIKGSFIKGNFSEYIGETAAELYYKETYGK